MAIDLTNVNLTTIPETEVRTEIKQACLPLEIKWLSDIIVDRFPSEWICGAITAEELRLDYKNFLPSKCDVDSRAFGKMLTKMNCPGIVKGSRSSEGMSWCIDRQVVYDWLLSKGYIDSSEILQTPISISRPRGSRAPEPL